MEEKVLGKSFEEMETAEMENVFGGSDETAPRATPTILITIISGATASAVSGIVSYNKECLG